MPRRCEECGTFEPYAALGHPSLGYRLVSHSPGTWPPFYFEEVEDETRAVCADEFECHRRRAMQMWETAHGTPYRVSSAKMIRQGHVLYDRSSKKRLFVVGR